MVWHEPGAAERRRLTEGDVVGEYSYTQQRHDVDTARADWKMEVGKQAGQLADHTEVTGLLCLTKV